MKPEDFAGRAPAFALEDFFAGEGKAWGLFQDRFGNVRKQFVADTRGTWNPAEGKLTLTESFTYDDGSQEERTWHIAKLGEGRYRAETHDLLRVHLLVADVAGVHLVGVERDVVAQRGEAAPRQVAAPTAARDRNQFRP